MIFDGLDYGKRLDGCKARLQQLLTSMDDLQQNINLSECQKLDELKTIREEINKVGLEIDILKKEIKLLSVRHLN